DAREMEQMPDWAYRSMTTDAPHAYAGLLLLLAAFYGFLGVVLSGMMRCGWQGALLLIVPVIFTSLMNPLTAPFTSLQFFAGLLVFSYFRCQSRLPMRNRTMMTMRMIDFPLKASQRVVREFDL